MAWNATLILTDGTTTTTKTSNGATTTVYSFQSYDVNITSFNTGLQTQYDSSQVHRGVSWFPIRRSEQFVQFIIDWPLISAHVNSRPVGFENIPYRDGFARMNKLQDAIRIHQQVAALCKGSNTPVMTLVYNNNSSGDFNPMIGKQKSALVYRGWIDISEKEHARFKNVFRRNYRMNLLMPANDNIAALTPGWFKTGDGTAYNFAPTTADVKNIGKDWTSIDIYRNTGFDIKKIPGGN